MIEETLWHPVALSADVAQQPLAVRLLAHDLVLWRDDAAAVHAWAIGAIGLMSVAVMASMIRRHSRTPFAVSGLMSLSLASVAVAAPARIAAEIVPDGRQYWLILSASGWVAGFALFLLAFRNPLLRRRDMV